MATSRKKPLHLGLPARLRDVRAERGLSLRQLAIDAGVGPSTPHQIEGKPGRQVSTEIVEKLAGALGVSPAWLAYGLGPRETGKG